MLQHRTDEDNWCIPGGVMEIGESFAFYHPTSDMFFVGDVNQMANPALPVRLVMRLAMSIKS